MPSNQEAPPPSYSEHLQPVSPSFYQPRIRDFQPYVAPQAGSDSASTISKQPPVYTTHQHPTYRNEEDYLSELKKWAQQKDLVTVSEDALVGFYGHRTMNQYLPPAKQKKLEQRLKYGRKGSKSSDSSESSSEKELEKKKRF